MLDPLTALPTDESYGINANFTLVEIATNKPVINGTTFSRVSYDIPGSYQRFARSRAVSNESGEQCRLTTVATHSRCAGEKPRAFAGSVAVVWNRLWPAKSRSTESIAGG